MRIKIFSLTQKKNLKSQTKREIFFVRCLSLLCLRSVFSLFAFLIKVKAFGARKREKKKKKKKKKNQRAKKIICSLSLSLSLSLFSMFFQTAPEHHQHQHRHNDNTHTRAHIKWPKERNRREKPRRNPHRYAFTDDYSVLLAFGKVFCWLLLGRKI